MSRPPLSASSETVRMQLVITADEIQAIDEWRNSNDASSRSEAVRRLIALGLSVSHPPLSDRVETTAPVEKWG
jgi:metal-responsive CopG/Arc/MetJ family transcriptional regulator